MGTVMTTSSTSANLTTVFISNNSKNRILTCTSGDAVHWSENSGVGAETSPVTPAVAAFGGKVWVAFIANDSSHRVLISSSEDGKTFTANQTIGQASKAAPSLCVFQGKLWIAFIANDSSNNILVCSSDDGVHWSGNTKVNQTSPFPPSLCVYKDKLFLAFASNSANGGDTRVRNILICYSSDGTHWSANTKLNESTKDGPSLCAFKDKLWLAFVASGDNNELLVVSSSDGTNFSGNTRINQASYKAPSLSAINDKMYVGFTSANDKLDVLVCSSSDGTHWSGNVGLGQTSKAAPALLAQEFTTGTVRPRYQLLTVVYAPPGTNGGKSTSQVVYANSSAAGATSSISKSFKGGVEVSAKVGDDKAASAGGSFAYSKTTTDTSTIDVKKTDSYALTVNGPAADGIDHDHDMYYIALNPLFTISVDNWNNVTWSMGVDGSTMTIQYVYAGWLKDPSKMPKGLKATLDAAGLTTDDYAQILGNNPLANGATTIDSARYMPTGQSFPYIPPYSASDPVPVQTYKHENSITTSESRKTESQYTVTATVTQGVPSVWSTKVVGTLQWTNTNTYGTSSTSTQSAQVSVGGPGYGYDGPSDVLVYWDSIYSTFMFAFPAGTADATGSVTSSTGAALVNEKVSMTVGTKTYTTYTDAKGNYRFYGTGSGQGKVTVKGQSQAVAVGKAAQKATIKLTS